jgi:hypothetical protein
VTEASRFASISSGFSGRPSRVVSWNDTWIGWRTNEFTYIPATRRRSTGSRSVPPGNVMSMWKSSAHCEVMNSRPVTKIQGSVETRSAARQALKPTAVISAPKRLSGRRSHA